jgi:hypothetical protein
LFLTPNHTYIAYGASVPEAEAMTTAYIPLLTLNLYAQVQFPAVKNFLKIVSAIFLKSAIDFLCNLTKALINYETGD